MEGRTNRISEDLNLIDVHHSMLSVATQKSLLSPVELSSRNRKLAGDR